MKHPVGPLGLGPQKIYKPDCEIHPHATCLDCKADFWGHTWDELFNAMGWHYSKHVIHVWD